MPSKGVDYYAFLSTSYQGDEFEILFQWPDGQESYVLTGAELQMFHQNVQLDSNGLSTSSKTFVWTGSQAGTQIAQQQAVINPWTGQLEPGTTLGDMLGTTSQVVPNASALSYGFYDSSSGFLSTLTNQDQVYVYLTRDVSNWMGSLAQSVPGLSGRPLATFALPGAHDCGMFTPANLGSILNSDELAGQISQKWGFSTESLNSYTASQFQNLLVSLGFTQKDTITTMLDLGARYFDFRPGYIDGSAFRNPTEIYHIHNFIPGYSYTNFMTDVLDWLQLHPTEVVVVSLSFDGFLYSSMQPSQQDLEKGFAMAVSGSTAEGLNIGSVLDLYRPYGNLVVSNTRLIFLNQIEGYSSAAKYDSYSDAYQTADVNNIIVALAGMTSAGQAGNNYTVMQLQGTATGTMGVWTSIDTASGAASALMSTKAMFDNQTYPWLLDNLTAALTNNQLVVLLNDFIDNALATYAAAFTQQRVQGRGFQVFAVGRDGSFWSTYLDPITGWLPWSEPFGGLPATVTIGSVAMGLSAHGDMEAFATGSDGSLWMNWRPAFEDWKSNWVAPPIGSPPGTKITSVAIGQAANGDLQVFAIGSGGRVWFNYLAATGSWSNWGSGPAGMPETTQIESIEMGQAVNGDLQVFAVDSVGKLWFNYLSRSGWQSWMSPPFGEPGTKVASVAMAQEPNGTLLVLAVGTDNSLWAITCQSGIGWFIPWKVRWTMPGVKSVTMAQAGDGSLQIFGVGADGSLLYNCCNQQGWQEWTSQQLGASHETKVASVAMAQAPSGALQAFAIMADGTVLFNWYVASVTPTPSGSWESNWAPPPFGVPGTAIAAVVLTSY